MTASPTIVVLTGSNSGLGYETVKSLLASSVPYKIYCGARSLDKARKTVDSLSSAKKPADILVPLVLDVSSDESIAAATKTVAEADGRVDVLINNAGINIDSPEGLDHDLRKTWSAMFDTNVIGAHVLTAQVATLLLKSSSPRVLFVTSDLGSLSKTLEPEYGPNRPIQAGWPKYWKDDWPGYRASKAAMNMLMRQWARFFEKDGVRVWAVNPGFCQTYLAGRGPEALKAMGAKDPAIAADFFRSVVEGERDADAGQYIELEGRIEW